MNLVLTQKKSKKNATKNDNSLNHLWNKVEKQRKQNEKLESEMDQLMQTYQTKILPLEKECLLPEKTRLVERLIELFSRKSLANWHRDEMADWLRHLVGHITHLDRETGVEMCRKFDDVVANLNGMTKEELEELKEQDKAEADESLRALIEGMLGQEISDEDWESGLSVEEIIALYREKAEKEREEQVNSDSSFEQKEFFDFFEEESSQSAQSDSKQQKSFNDFFGFEDQVSQKQEDSSTQKLGKNWIKQIFRKAARALHPDKEQDPEKIETKQKIMSQLIQARDDQDVLTLVKIYCEHVSDGDLEIADNDIKHINELLNAQYIELTQQRLNIIHQTPFHEHVYESLYASSKKGRERKLNTMMSEIKEDAKQTEDLRLYLRNLTRLKEILEDRQFQMTHQWMD